MRAYQVTRFDTPPQFCDVALPAPGPGQIAVDIRACALNFADLLMIRGTYQETPEPPFTLGMELAGVVTGTGDAVEGFERGDRVAVYSGQGGLADHGVFNAARAVRMPDAMGFEAAASVLVAYGTGHLSLVRRARLQPGETLLVTGAAGGVGLTAVEIGAKMGARVIAQARGAEKLEIARKAGAEHLIDASEDLRERVLQLGGADVVYETIGGDVFRAAFRATRPEGRILPIGFAGGEVPQIPANHLLVKNLTVIGVNIGAYLNVNPNALRESFMQVLRWCEAGNLQPHISHVLPLADATEGLRLLKERKSTGKVVISMT
ncbi:NADPH:quinone oxidoreductase family protein [Ruegeria sp. 2012CJ41-6]|uniref:NADPH:quinone oxidoreductase family protein n=1 Tax=Ruegeria spongiae TaxID=2942209 RepID=A0ABT0Q073_9RHOB|nr:NADPH:quinone oxidoreductase family protein [Ruegeria spongiae]MCL6283203.1 NADPH:quinone oxidoreductase family protein [Ruegeria spongiae]